LDSSLLVSGVGRDLPDRRDDVEGAMTRDLVAYANALSLVIFAQAVEIENLRRRLDGNAATLIKCKETIEALMEAAFGKVEVFDQEG
jgi:hypothetical protein